MDYRGRVEHSAVVFDGKVDGVGQPAAFAGVVHDVIHGGGEWGEMR
jgi:hypothetical protein